DLNRRTGVWVFPDATMWAFRASRIHNDQKSPGPRSCLTLLRKNPEGHAFSHRLFVVAVEESVVIDKSIQGCQNSDAAIRLGVPNLFSSRSGSVACICRRIMPSPPPPHPFSAVRQPKSYTRMPARPYPRIPNSFQVPSAKKSKLSIVCSKTPVGV